MNVIKPEPQVPLYPEDFYNPDDGLVLIAINQHETLEDGRWYVVTGYTGGGAKMGVHTDREKTAMFLKTMLAPGELVEIEDVWYWKTPLTEPRVAEEYLRQREDRARRRSPTVCTCPRCGTPIRQQDVETYNQTHAEEDVQL